MPAAVPQLVDVVDRRPDRLAEADLAGDRRPALAADLLHGAPCARPGHADADQPAQAERERLGRGQVPDREGGVRERRPLDRGLAALDGDVVAAEDLGDGRRVRRAARVLQECRIEERRPVGLGHAHPIGDAHGQERGPQGVARELALGQVERGRERGEQPGRGHGLPLQQAQPRAARRVGGRSVEVTDDEAIGGDRRAEGGGRVGRLRVRESPRGGAVHRAAIVVAGLTPAAARWSGPRARSYGAPTSCRRRPDRAPRG